ncbi:cyclin-dependent protein serine/threonine kinase inhibiting protein FAR1 [Kluyveromyces lactis]|uniref:KLLA0B07469p n=1 Tax=Kluyveromyces lactis (strain ATCC 8585 / CBS 2359 / DSM 70799 / NBRC 1267 / NRRL Y-1140 / WM37) TaxID=284590 RepID=Q6CW28_KLULA|nr:uncharacterized protein KLLA0_B07469g [Kluyveromyces lactis]CAH02254.1 KLLA0B07469p [Kluyveromyces lactis]|eukprot:XP_451861.1 uncharacterized protein KLLA0_B07469g [Kluyveromyces lactis]
MMQLRTPLVERPKKTHTPPSGDRNTPSSSSKFLKDVTGKGFRKISTRLSRTTPTDSTITLSPEVEYVETFPEIPNEPSKKIKGQLDFFKKRPTPLNLSPLTPPSSLKKKSVCDQKDADLAKLESPIELKFDNSKKNARRPAPPMEQSILSFHSNLFDPHYSFTADADSKPFGLGLYDEVSSPTCMMQMQRNIRKASATKRYNTCTCSVCQEKIQNLLGGERIIELECSHQCHMDCFTAMMDSTTFKPPICQLCGKRSNSLDEQVTQDLVLRKMKEITKGRSNSESTLFDRGFNTATKISDDTVLQTLTADTRTSETSTELSGRKLVTPRSQLIRTAQLSSNGFRDVFDMLDEKFDISTPRQSISVDPLDIESKPKDKLRVSICPKLNKYTVNEQSSKIILPHLLSVHLPKEDDMNEIRSVQVILCISAVNSNTAHQSKESYLAHIKNIVRKVLSSLKKDEYLGLIIVGRDGNGRSGCRGTFYGFVSNTWDGWDEILAGLKIIDNTEEMIFPNPIWEAKEMLQTVERLMLTAIDLDEAEVRHLIILSGTHDTDRRITKLEDNLYEQKVEQLLEKMMNKYHCSVSQWISEDEMKPLLLQDYTPQWQYSVYTEFFNKNSCHVEQYISKLRRVPLDTVSITLQPCDTDIVKIHTMYFNGSLFPCEGGDKEAIELKLGPFGYGDFKSIIVEVEVDVPKIQKWKEETGSSISLLGYRTSQDPGVFGVSSTVSIELHPTCSSPALSQTTSLFHIADADTDADPDAEAETSCASLFLDLPLVPPSSPSCDSLFVTRQIQLMVIESLRKLTTDTVNKTVPETTIRELTSVVFGMSRDCTSMNLQYYDEIGHENKLENHIELLTQRLEQILHHNNPKIMMHKLIQWLL